MFYPLFIIRIFLEDPDSTIADVVLKNTVKFSGAHRLIKTLNTQTWNRMLPPGADLRASRLLATFSVVMRIWEATEVETSLYRCFYLTGESAKNNQKVG